MYRHAFTHTEGLCFAHIAYLYAVHDSHDIISLTELPSWSVWCSDCVLSQVQTKFLYVRLTKLVPLKPCPCAQVSHRPLTTKAGCDPRPFPVVFMVDIVAVGQVLLPVLQFSPVSIIHRCSTLMFIYAFPLPGQTGVAWEPSKKNILSDIWELRTQMYFRFFGVPSA
jgi:hypothetical protein